MRLIGRRHTNTHRLPTVPPVPPRAPQPAWSVMLPCHDDADLLADALASVLAQDPGADAMQIVVIDDHSTVGDPAAVAHDLAGDRVQVVHHPRTLGAPATFTDCVRRSRGRWVHLLHADDAVEPGFYASYQAAFEATAAVMAVGRSWFVDADGRRLGLSGELPTGPGGLLVDPVRVLGFDNPVNFAAVVVDRAAYERVGGFDPALAHANDWEMWTRLAAVGDVAVVAGEWARYRRHDGSDTSRLRRSLTYVSDPAEAVRVIAGRCEDRDLGRRLRHHAGGLLAAEALRVGNDQLAEGELRLAAGSAWWAARLDPSPPTLHAAGRLAGRAVRRRLGAPGRHASRGTGSRLPSPP